MLFHEHHFRDQGSLAGSVISGCTPTDRQETEFYNIPPFPTSLDELFQLKREQWQETGKDETVFLEVSSLRLLGAGSSRGQAPCCPVTAAY